MSYDPNERLDMLDVDKAYGSMSKKCVWCIAELHRGCIIHGGHIDDYDAETCPDYKEDTANLEPDKQIEGD